MSLSEQAVQELLDVHTPLTSARMAEAATLIRFAGGISAQGGVVAIEASFAQAAIAERLKSLLEGLFETTVALRIVAGTKGNESRHTLRLVDGAPEIIRRLGLVTRGGSRVIGLPPMIVSGELEDAEAAWRGAFLVGGVLTDPGRSSALEVACPNPEVALALSGLAGRLDINARTKESRGVDRVYVRDGDNIGALLTRMGAHVVRIDWEDKRRRQQARASTNRLANFDDANLRRSARAAITGAARARRAMEILGDDVPEHLLHAGQLRIQYHQASLEELGRLADPPMTKDAMAGRIRRLFINADKRAAELGIPDTKSAIPEDDFGA